MGPSGEIQATEQPGRQGIDTMKALRSVATKHPLWFALSATVVWFVLSLVFVGIASSALGRPYGDATTGTVSRLAVTACVLVLLWRLGWLKAAGVARLGRWRAWLLALAGTLYFASASLYAFYGEGGFSILARMAASGAWMTIVTQLGVALSEEILFRGLVLYALIRAWGDSARGKIGGVALTSLLFAGLHLTNVFAYGVSLPAASFLTLETFVVSVWWGALVLLGGSIWPAVMLHFVVNAVVALQGLSRPMVEPDILAYSRVLWFSLPLGVLGIGLLLRAAPSLTLARATD
jgi:hypothetical protein